MFSKRPYLVIPKLIVQPTWGGTYIPTVKQWMEKDYVKGRKFGQSYELFGETKLRVDVTRSDDPTFIPEIGNPDDDKTEAFPLAEGTQYVKLDKATAQQVPILIKLTQALGNSFQLHVKPGAPSDHWKPKPETWFYFEDGLATCGLAPGVDVDAYRRCCKEIEQYMMSLSQQIQSKELELEQGEKKAQAFIKEKNPWQYVNTVQVKKDEVVDMSSGGIHHSWEEDGERCPQGNILYEVQLDAMDPVSTIRCFDQGKIKSDGSIRPIQIDDYFTYLDTLPEHNIPSRNITHPTGSQICATPYYSLERLTVDAPIEASTTDSFAHFYVTEGELTVTATDGMVVVGAGHSCFVPREVGAYRLENNGTACTVLKTFI